MATNITVANTEWEIIDDVADALKEVTIAGDVVFPRVVLTTDLEQARETQFSGDTPFVVIRYLGTTEYECIEGERGGQVQLELLIGAKKDRGVDEAVAVKEALRLTNAAKNAIHLNEPADAVADYMGSEFEFHNKIEWGQPTIDTTEHQPWATCLLPVALSFHLDSSTSH